MCNRTCLLFRSTWYLHFDIFVFYKLPPTSFQKLKFKMLIVFNNYLFTRNEKQNNWPCVISLHCTNTVRLQTQMTTQKHRRDNRCYGLENRSYNTCDTCCIDINIRYGIRYDLSKTNYCNDTSLQIRKYKMYITCMECIIWTSTIITVLELNEQKLYKTN